MDSPGHPRAIDGNTLAHLAFGFGLGAVLLEVGMEPAAMVGVVGAVAVFWEIIENMFPQTIALVLGPPSYTGDSWINLICDIIVAVAAAAVTIEIGVIPAAVTAGVLVALWILWAIATSHLPAWAMCSRTEPGIHARLVPEEIM